MNIIKGNGDRVSYDSKKVRASLRRSGASEKLVKEVLSEIEPKIKDGMRTGEIYRMVREALKKKKSPVATRYNLRDSLFKLGPAGFKFEKYVASILQAYGYEAEVPENELHGVCVDHEVDVVAVKDKRRVMIEAKFRNNIKGDVDLKDTMATWSRFLDLVEAGSVGKGPDFDELWIVTNARFSDRSRQFGVCKGIRLIGWKYPEEHSFEQMVDHNLLYPLTIIDDIKSSELDSFSEQGLMLCKEIADEDDEKLKEKLGFSLERISTIKQKCQEATEPAK